MSVHYFQCFPVKWGHNLKNTCTSANTPTHKPVAIGRASLGDLGRCSFQENHQSPLLLIHQLYPEAKGGGCHSSCRVVTGQGALGCWGQHHPTAQSPGNKRKDSELNRGVSGFIYGHMTPTLLWDQCSHGHALILPILSSQLQDLDLRST